MAKDVIYINFDEMDIDSIPAHTQARQFESIVIKWAISARTDENGVATILFKKDTPQKILDLFDKKHSLLPFPVHEHYQIES
jgi:hypothetical protein